MKKYPKIKGIIFQHGDNDYSGLECRTSPKRKTKNLQLLFIARKICDIIIQITTKETDSEEGNRYK